MYIVLFSNPKQVSGHRLLTETLRREVVVRSSRTVAASTLVATESIMSAVVYSTIHLPAG